MSNDNNVANAILIMELKDVIVSQSISIKNLNEQVNRLMTEKLEKITEENSQESDEYDEED